MGKKKRVRRLKITDAHVQQRRRRNRAIVIQARRVIHIVLRNGGRKRLREAVGIGRYRVSILKVPRQMVLVVDVVVDLE